MATRYLLQAVSLGAILYAFGYSELAGFARADHQAVAALPQKSLPAPPRKSLPARDCLSCPGPPASAPCFHTHRGFLYYGTYPWDDDPVNGFDDCPRGQCGYAGAALSLGWIRMHEAKRMNAGHHHRSTGGCRTCNTVPHYLHDRHPAEVVPQSGEAYR